jgi:FMN-dependent NADH-azoreductase
MSRVLHLDSSIQTSDSVSRNLSAAIVDKLKVANRDLDVIYRDLVANPLPHITMPVFAAFVQGTEVPGLSPEQQADVIESKKVLEEFLAADTIVIGVPLYNYSVPSTLRAWIDRIVVAGKTFSYGANGPTGFAGGKRVILSLARGGIFTGGGAKRAA